MHGRKSQGDKRSGRGDGGTRSARQYEVKRGEEKWICKEARAEREWQQKESGRHQGKTAGIREGMHLDGDVPGGAGHWDEKKRLHVRHDNSQGAKADHDSWEITIVSGTECRNKNVAETNDEKGFSTYTVTSEKSEKEPGRRK